jgi:hypothetical protein
MDDLFLFRHGAPFRASEGQAYSTPSLFAKCEELGKKKIEKMRAMADPRSTPGPPRGRPLPGRRRFSRPRLAAVATAWVAVTGGFVAYLTSLDSFKDAYGGVGTGALLLVWITLFSVLFRITPRLRSARGPQAPAPLAAAVRSRAAQARLLSVMGPRAGRLTPREQEMVDWGFAFGIAWAVAQRQDPAAPEAVVSARALQAARAVRSQPYRD